MPLRDRARVVRIVAGLPLFAVSSGILAESR
jgi:hypothetical protein